MSETRTSISQETTGYTLAFLTLRIWLGVRALLTGIEKFSGVVAVQKPLLDAQGNPDPSGAIVEIEQKIYGLKQYAGIPESLKEKFVNEPLLPSFLTSPFYASLGALLIILGLMLLLGLWSRVSLFAMGLMYTALTIGLILIKQDPGVSSLGVHIALICGALVLSKYNRFSITK